MKAGGRGPDPHGLERARDAVMDVLMVDGLLIALSGWALSRSGYTLTPGEPWLAQRLAYVPLLILMFTSIGLRRIWAARWRLADPNRRAGRVIRAHLASALVGSTAIPLGFLFARTFLPTLRGVGPFWVVGLAMTWLAMPGDRLVEGLAKGASTDQDEWAR